MVDLLAELKKNPFVLAPMAAITDSAFRSFMREMGCGVVISELVSSHGIKYSGAKTLSLMAYTEAQRPVGIQLFGEDPEIMAEAARFVEQQGADFVDINLGCPVPKVVKKGAGAGLLRDPIFLNKYLKTIKAAIGIPLTIKIRTGWDDNSRNALEIVHAAHDAGVTWVAIHGRTRAQGYTGFADWDLIREVKAKSPLPIIGNGDINSASRALGRLRESGCDGVMIGRGCLKNPWIFSQALQMWRLENQNVPSETATVTAGEAGNHAEKDFCGPLKRLKYFIDERNDIRYSLITMKKFTSWFSAGYPNSQQFRRSLFDAKSSSEVLGLAEGYFSQFDISAQIDTSAEAFLMGGHG